ncbi:hypothetical protein J4460_07300 [Candidatus Woesearchaeota archaeon]|nr:hypothetical protein [Candidatus Woesearchaeota archaeon]HIH37972.1 hypothetical protein [Candidatus Woesearchaeota archaeon]HIH48576.1 hypothetical protein [Candidatus Woesearchaeota archaeon]HIJ03567.1 hypothetical protein [Candidatus Woesearchaeota archaeon]
MASTLIGCVTHDRQAYCIDRFLRTVFGTGMKIVFIDNSRTDAYAALLRKRGLSVIRDEDPSETRIGSIISSRNKLREHFLSTDFT